MAAEKRDLKALYLGGDPEVLKFAAWPWPISDFQPVIDARAAVAVPREVLVSELKRQNGSLPDSAFTLQQIDRLRSPKTFTVTTGHQVCLFGGPMFTLHKIASTIALAQSLKQLHPGYDFVPILWMATEDHDWEEVNHYHPSFAEKRTYQGTFRGPVGRHRLDDSISEILPENAPDWLANAYHPGQTLGEAFRQLMHRLFGHHGLVILDADRHELKAVFNPVMAAELQMNGIAGHARATSQALEMLGFKPQILPRSINLFYLGNGDRVLIDKIDNGFQLKGGGKIWSESEMLAELTAFPENFSPNVALRPVYQETLLPNVATIGGWAEISYWLQLKSGFEAMGVPYPPLVPRMHATIFTAEQAVHLRELNLQLSWIAEPLHVLNDRYLEQSWNGQPVNLALSDIKTAYERLASLIANDDPTLATAIKAEEAKASNFLEGIPKKLKKSLRNRNPQPYQRIAAIKNSVEPENVSQQRVLNFTAFATVNPLTLADILIDQAKNAKSDTQWITLP